MGTVKQRLVYIAGPYRAETPEAVEEDSDDG